MRTPPPADDCPPSCEELAATLAKLLRESKDDLVQRWLDRITARVTVDPMRLFPSETLLDHVPLLIEGLADQLEFPGRRIEAGTPVGVKARELGALRHEQGFDAYEILKEHEILGGIVFSFLGARVSEIDRPLLPGDVAACWHRVAHAIELIRQATMTHFLHLSAEQVREREELLRRFNRMVSHELKNRISAIRGAASLLQESWISEPERARFEHMIRENAEGMQRVLDNLLVLSRIETDSRRRKNVLLPRAAAEAARQLRAAAAAKGVKVSLHPGLPPVEVDAAAVELCLTNYLSNAIKYADPKRADRWVRVSGELRFGSSAAGGELIVRVHDNGRGVPEEAREQLFERFFRAHDESVSGIEGTGLGLSLVRETVESLGGSAWAEFPAEGGSIFAFSLPSRRQEDAAAAGTHRAEAGDAA